MPSLFLLDALGRVGRELIWMKFNLCLFRQPFKQDFYS